MENTDNKHYNVYLVRKKIKDGEITRLRQIVNNIPMTVIGAGLGCSITRIRNMMKSPTKVTATEVFALADFFEVEYPIIMSLIKEQVKADKKSGMKAVK